jgi:mannosyl-3-phosphoglycerate phosphatase
MAQPIVFTDLDGTLLDAETYRFDAALPALALLKERGVPLVLCSSKTRSEIEAYRERLGNDHPFIAENGGGIFIPDAYFPFPVGGEWKGLYKLILLGSSYGTVRAAFRKLRDELGVNATGFGDLSVDEVAALTGLSPDEARRAKERDCDEPFFFDEAERRAARFLKAIEKRGLRWTQGRFHHIMGDNDKGKAVAILKRFYQRHEREVVTVGIGDSLNDLPMLRETDHPFLVRKQDGSYDRRVALPGLVRTDGIGPQGWNAAVLAFFGS